MPRAHVQLTLPYGVMDSVYDLVLSIIGFNIAHCDNIHLGAKARTGGMGMPSWLPWKILMAMRYH